MDRTGSHETCIQRSQLSQHTAASLSNTFNAHFPQGSASGGPGFWDTSLHSKSKAAKYAKLVLLQFNSTTRECKVY